MTRLLLACASVLLMLLGPTVLGVPLRRRYRIPWAIFLAGVASFVLSQVVHLPMLWAMGRLGLSPTSADSITPMQALALGLAAGLCEETARLVLLRPLTRARSGADAVMFGLGHGGIEAMLLGGVLLAAQYTSLTALQHADLATVAKNPIDLEALRLKVQTFSQASPAWLLVAPLERVLAMGAQLAMSLLVMQAVRTGRPGYFAASVAYHTAVDGISVYVAPKIGSPLETELLVFLLIAPGVLWMAWQLQRSGMGPERRRSPFWEEWDRFRVMLRKELRQPWQTRSAFIVLAVFASAACLAAAVPLTLKLIPEEARAKLAASGLEKLPVASTPFALEQYIKLLSQLGFLAVVILAALSIAGERQRGALAMLFSKPAPRWGLVMAKAVAQLSVATAAISVGAGLAFALIWVGYGRPGLVAFLTINLLIILWLASYIAVSIAASCTAKTEGGAMGWTAVAIVVLLLLGAIPGVGGVAPSGLTGWAYELAAGREIHPNGGAIAFAITLSIIALLRAIDRLEEAEL